jgi:hypothetical protein
MADEKDNDLIQNPKGNPMKLLKIQHLVIAAVLQSNVVGALQFTNTFNFSFTK